MRALGTILGEIKIAHSVFALPFAILGLFLASGGAPEGRVLVLVLLAVVAARSAGMGMNRLADARLDALNPRTRGRALPAGRVGRGAVAAFVAGSAALFLLAAALLNPLALGLSPLVLAVLLGYPYMKRWSALSHLVLGLALALAPLGAWVAARGHLRGDLAPPLLLAGAVLLWTGGFDIIYACQDLAFDRRHGLRSIPARLGIARALRVSAGLHAGTLLLLWLFVRAAGMGPLALAGAAGVGLLLAYEHAIVRPGDLGRVNTAFFTVNGAVSLLFSALAIGDLLLRRG